MARTSFFVRNVSLFICVDAFIVPLVFLSYNYSILFSDHTQSLYIMNVNDIFLDIDAKDFKAASLGYTCLVLLPVNFRLQEVWY